MNLLNQKPDVPLTNAEKIALQLKQDAFNEYTRLVSKYENGLYRFWRNGLATPQEIADALGTDALSVFQVHGATKAIILQLKPDQVLSSVSDFGTYVVNPDGTLTITEVFPVPQPPSEEPI